MDYILMNKNIEVLMFSYDEDTHTITNIKEVIHPEYAPLGIMEYKTGISRKDLNTWWKNRSIPASRSKFKEVLDAMNISSSIALLEKCCGLSLSDQYWIKEVSSKARWCDLNFFQNEFSEDMGKLLMGQTEFSHSLDIFSPDNSSDGNLRKKWKIIDGKRYLMKGGNTFNNQEPFNELIATKLYERILDVHEYVPYVLVKEDGMYFSCCETMVSVNEELVPAYYIDRILRLRGNDSLYHHYIKACLQLGMKDIQQQIDKMLVCDYIIANFDRHYRNFGAIRNIETLTWMKAAPLFDSGSSLWAMTPTLHLGSPYKSKPFKANPEEQLDLVKDYTWLNEEKLLDFHEEVQRILRLNPLCDEGRDIIISKLVKQRIETVIQKKRNGK